MKTILFPLLALSSTLVTFSSHGIEGMIHLVNNNGQTFVPMELLDLESGTTSPVPTTLRLNYGVFVNDSPTPSLRQPLGTSSTNQPGIIVTGGTLDYLVEGTIGGQTVSMQVRAWSAAFGTDWQAAKAAGAHFGETDVRQVTLPFFTAGVEIWQTRSGTDPKRFYPIVVQPPLNELNVDDITAAEGSNGVANAVFTIRLSRPRTETVSVDFSTQDGTALAGQDYIATNETVQFPPGVTERAVTVTLTPDEPLENDETFFVVLTNPVNGRIGKSTGTAVITEARITGIRIDAAITFHTLAGRHYAVEKSLNLETWMVLPNATNVLGVGGPVTVYDQAAGFTGPHYYRTRLLSQ